MNLPNAPKQNHDTMNNNDNNPERAQPREPK